MSAMSAITASKAARQAAACAAVLFFAGCSYQPEEPTTRLDQGALLAATCTGCHAPGGSGDAIPGFGNRSAAELEALLLAYKADGPSSMHRMARGYSDEELALIAQHLAGMSRGDTR